jgi:hypothetical protein
VIQWLFRMKSRLKASERWSGVPWLQSHAAKAARQTQARRGHDLEIADAPLGRVLERPHPAEGEPDPHQRDPGPRSEFEQEGPPEHRMVGQPGGDPRIGDGKEGIESHRHRDEHVAGGATVQEQHRRQGQDDAEPDRLQHAALPVGLVPEHHEVEQPRGQDEPGSALEKFRRQKPTRKRKSGAPTAMLA